MNTTRHNRPAPAVTTVAVVDLTRTPADRRRHAAWELVTQRPGARVRLVVGNLGPAYDVAEILAEVVTTRELHLQVEGAPNVVDAWAHAIHAAHSAQGISAPTLTRPQHLRLVTGGGEDA